MPKFIISCESNGDCYVIEDQGSFEDYSFELDEDGNLYYEEVEKHV